MQIGGIPAAVAYSGLAPGFAGLYQINALVPLGLPTNDAAPIRVIYEGFTTAQMVTMAVGFTPAPTPGAVRSSYVRVDGPIFDTTYDPVHKLVFAANPQLNQVEVVSSVTRKRIASLPIPQAIALDVTADGSRVWVGTSTESIYGIDPATLEVREHVLIPRVGFIPRSSSRKLVTASNGMVLMIAGNVGTTNQGLLKWNPATNEFTDPGFGASELVRSGDHTKVLASSGGTLILYDAATDSFFVDGSTGGFRVAANHNGTQFAALVNGVIIFLDAQLQPLGQGQVSTTFAGEILYSFDGRWLYVHEDVTILATSSLFTVIDTQTYSVIGRVQDLNFSGFTPIGTKALDIDETGLIFSVAPRGLGLVEASTPGAVATPLPLIAPPTGISRGVSPPQGPGGMATNVTVSGGHFRPGASLFFGDRGATNVNVTTGDPVTITATSPTTDESGPVNVIAVFPDGTYALAAEAFSYGPTVLYLNPSGGPPGGGAVIEIFGYGFGTNPAQIQVQVGGSAAEVLTTPSRVGDAEGPSPLLSFLVRVPGGAPGPADVVVTTPTGSTMVPGGFHYLKSVAEFPVAGEFGTLLYDRLRNRVYMSNRSMNRIEVFSVKTRQFLNPIPVGTDPLALALTPDGQTLLVTNTVDGTVTIVNPDNPGGAVAVPVLAPGDTMLDPRAWRIVATSTGKAFISVLHLQGGGCQGYVRELDLGSHAVTTRTDQALSCVSNPLMASTRDGTAVFLAMAGSSGGEVSIWEAATNEFTGRQLGDFLEDSAAAGDGNVFATDFKFLDAEVNFVAEGSLVDLLAGGGRVLGEKLHESGSLLYIPTVIGVLIFDTAHANLRRWYVEPEAIPNSFPAMAIDETGKTVFTVSSAGLRVAELAVVPLSIGSVSPADGPSVGGTLVMIRGSGFQNGTVVLFGGVEVVTTFVDENTLTVNTPGGPPGSARVTVRNPDGEEYSLDAAFRFN